MYDDLDYARGRLIGTVVRDGDGDPIFIGDLMYGGGGRIVALYTPLSDPEISNCSFDDFISTETASKLDDFLTDLDLSSPPLGYSNEPWGANYIRRVPLRRCWRQGLVRSNITADMEYTFGGLRKCILGQYPSFLQAAEDDKITAFSRQFAIGDGAIFYRGKRVGIRENSLELEEDYFWLRESLAESLEGQLVL